MSATNRSNKKKLNLVSSGPSVPTVRYFTTFQNTIFDVLASRGWQQVEEGDEFDFVWADREWVYSAFDRIRLEVLSNFRFSAVRFFIVLYF